MGCGCKKKSQEKQVVQQPPANIRLTEVQQTNNTTNLSEVSTEQETSPDTTNTSS